MNDNLDYHATLKSICEIMQGVLEKITSEKVSVTFKTEYWDFQFTIEINEFRRLSPSYDPVRVDFTDLNSVMVMYMETLGLAYLSYIKESDNDVRLSVNFLSSPIHDAMHKTLIKGFEEHRLYLAPAYIVGNEGEIKITEVSFLPVNEFH